LTDVLEVDRTAGSRLSLAVRGGRGGSRLGGERI